MSGNPLDLSDRTILVTGASGGIGRECAALLSALNARLVIAGRDPEKLKQTFSLLQGSGHVIESFDFSATDQIVDWVKKISTEVGPLYGFVHSAGKQAVAPVRSLTPAALEDQLRVNLLSSMMLARGFCQRGCSVKGAGSLVFVSSVRANLGKAGAAAYSASKAALEGFVRCLAMELARDKVRANCLSPAMVETEMTAELKELMLPEQWAALEREHPLGFGTPRDVANAAAFLLADTSRWITGTTLLVDGGFSAQ